MPAGVPCDDQHQLVSVYLTEERVLRGERAQFGVAGFGKLDDLGARGVEIRQCLRESGEASGGLHHIGRLPPLASVGNHCQHACLSLWIDR